MIATATTPTAHTKQTPDQSLSELSQHLDFAQQGEMMHSLMSDLFPCCLSLTGSGVRKALSILQQHISLRQHEVPTGTAVFDWTVPKEWNIKDAYVKNANGEKVVDFQQHNLHVLNYSVPIQAQLTFKELKSHLFTLPEAPDLIPYRTSYYNENWGFCFSHNEYLKLDPTQTYEVFIDSSLEDGHLSYGEYFIPGETADEILISCHICHPSLANDNLSGISLAIALAQQLNACSDAHPLRYSYRFLFIPATIGSITWLARNEATVSRIKHGLVLTCVGDRGPFTYKKSRQGNTEIDQAVIHALTHSGYDYSIQDFFPYGYDERQYCSPGFNLAVGCFMRSPHGTFPEYHTSADDLNFVTPQSLAESLQVCLSAFNILEHNQTYLSHNSKCEPQLGKRGLYKKIGGQKEGAGLNQMAILWALNLADGEHSLLDMAERSGLSFHEIQQAVAALASANLLTLTETAEFPIF